MLRAERQALSPQERAEFRQVTLGLWGVNAVPPALGQANTLIVAGKGHEEGQTVGSVTLPFSDHAELRKALEELDR